MDNNFDPESMFKRSQYFVSFFTLNSRYSNRSNTSNQTLWSRKEFLLYEDTKSDSLPFWSSITSFTFITFGSCWSFKTVGTFLARFTSTEKQEID